MNEGVHWSDIPVFMLLQVGSNFWTFHFHMKTSSFIYSTQNIFFVYCMPVNFLKGITSVGYLSVRDRWRETEDKHEHWVGYKQMCQQAFTTSVYASGVGWEAVEMIGMKVIASLGLLSAVTAATLVWSFLHAYFTPLPAFLADILFPVLEISLFC